MFINLCGAVVVGLILITLGRTLSFMCKLTPTPRGDACGCVHCLEMSGDVRGIFLHPVVQTAVMLIILALFGLALHHLLPSGTL